ncbi:MAG: Kelch repeat-containing protein, partial [Planctomycetota bacterium]
TNVQLLPLDDLEPNELYRLVISGTILSQNGQPLGADIEICFITVSPVPSVRPDQVVDLGDRMVVPRYLGRAVRLSDGRIVVIGGFRDPNTATDTIEVWDPAAQRFELLPARLATARGEHTATLLGDGRVLIAGGVAQPGGPPLTTTELLSASANGVSAGPDLNVARRWHGASRFLGGSGAVVSGGFGPTGDALDSVEILDGSSWKFHSDSLPQPTSQHLHHAHGADTVYVTAGNLRQQAAQIRSGDVTLRAEGDTRFRPAAGLVDGSRLFVVGGDTRSIVIHEFATNTSWLASRLLLQRRGAHTLTPRGETGHRFLAAGGFQITAGGRALATLEVVDYLPVGPFGTPDATVYPVTGAELPVPFAGHVGFVDNAGIVVLAGGWGDGVGDHSRRAVLILDGGSNEVVQCR